MFKFKRILSLLVAATFLVSPVSFADSPNKDAVKPDAVTGASKKDIAPPPRWFWTGLAGLGFGVYGATRTFAGLKTKNKVLKYRGFTSILGAAVMGYLTYENAKAGSKESDLEKSLEVDSISGSDIKKVEKKDSTKPMQIVEDYEESLKDSGVTK